MRHYRCLIYAEAQTDVTYMAKHCAGAALRYLQCELNFKRYVVINWLKFAKIFFFRSWVAGKFCTKKGIFENMKLIIKGFLNNRGDFCLRMRW